MSKCSPAGFATRASWEALRKVPRHRFVPLQMQASAYEDSPLPIGLGQTISQPYVVAFMTEALELQPLDRVLEIGTGSGYQAAVLSLLAGEVYSMEILEPLGREAEARLKEMGYANVRVRIGDGYRGWPEAAPFDAIIVTAAPPDVPPALVAQLRPGGRMVVPVGRYVQNLIRLRRTAKGLERESLLPVRFVPMVPEGDRCRSRPPFRFLARLSFLVQTLSQPGVQSVCWSTPLPQAEDSALPTSLYLRAVS